MGHEANTAIHLAEYRADYPGKVTVTDSAPIRRHGKRVWVTFENVDIDDGDFADLGRDWERLGKARRGRVGDAQSALMSMRDIVDFAATWFPKHQPGSLGD